MTTTSHGGSPEKLRRRVGIYTRARDAESLFRQRLHVERYVAHRPEWTITASYEELTERDMHRPALDRLLADAENGVLDVVAVRGMARLSRSIRDLARILRILDHRGVSIVTSDEGVDTATAGGRLFVSVVTGFVDSLDAVRRDLQGGTW